MLREIINKAKVNVKTAVVGLRKQPPSPQLRIERLYTYLDALYKTRDLPGAIVEVGCYQGATAAYAYRFLKGINCHRRYLCIDTFEGFPPDQFSADVALGTPARFQRSFAFNSERYVRKSLDSWGCRGVELLRGDISKISDDQLPGQIAVALLDVDLAEPTKSAFAKLSPRMVKNGKIIVDDCDDHFFKGALIAMKEIAPQAEYQLGVAIVNY